MLLLQSKKKKKKEEYFLLEIYKPNTSNEVTNVLLANTIKCFILCLHYFFTTSQIGWDSSKITHFEQKAEIIDYLYKTFGLIHVTV